MRVRAVLFDLDGTLLDTLEDLCDSVNRVLARNSFPPHPLDAYRYFIGDGAATLFTRALPPDHREERTLLRCLCQFREDYGINWNVKTRPYDGIPEMLDALVERGISLSVLSNKPHETTEKCVSGLLGRWSFDVVLGQREAVPKKPDPAGAQEIAGRIGIPPAAFVYLGDTGTDMRTARAAGMYPVGALWGFRPEEELRQQGARAFAETPRDFVAFIDARSAADAG
jgi:phosphoglycolate phosphatase